MNQEDERITFFAEKVHLANETPGPNVYDATEPVSFIMFTFLIDFI
jgi:hypothetical protein